MKPVMNGPRPSPLMINKNSHLIRKSSETKQQKGPIIIYTQSPKIIHTKAQDFMALVQRLTGNNGMSKEDSSIITLPQASENFGSSLSDGDNNSNSISINIKEEEKVQFWMQSHDGDETSSALRKREGESCVKGGAISPCINLNFADMPLFTPTSHDFLCSSYKFSESAYGILGSLISPSGLGFIKDLPEY